MHGECKLYYDNGLLHILCYYYNDRLVKEHIECFRSNNNCIGSIKIIKKLKNY